MRIRALVTALALLVSACGGGTSTEESTTLDAEAFERRVVDAAEDLVNRWGERSAFLVLLTSLDVGYSVEQIVEHAAVFEASGTIPGVDPAGEPLELLSRFGPGGEGPPAAMGSTISSLRAPRAALAAEDEQVPEDRYVEAVDMWASDIERNPFGTFEGLETFIDPGGSFIYLILMLIASGYTLEQVLVEVVLGGVAALSRETDEGSNCEVTFWLKDSAGDRIKPDGQKVPSLRTCFVREPASSSSTTLAGINPTDPAEPPDPDDDKTYRGFAVFNLVSFHPQELYDDSTCQTAPQAELVVRPDGTLTLTVTWTEWVWNSGVPSSGCRSYAEMPIVQSRTPKDRYVSVREGTWEGTAFTASVADPIHARKSTAPAFSGYFDGNLVVVDSTGLPYSGVGLDYVRVTLSFALAEATGG